MSADAKLRSLRDRNLQPDALRLSETDLRKLDSSLKKNSAFIKRLRAFSESTVDSLLKDLQFLNLTKYVSEAVQAIVQAASEGKVRMADVSGVVTVCSALHQRYKDFAPDLVPALAKALDVAAVVEEGVAAQKQQQQLLLQQQQQQVDKAAVAAPAAAAVLPAAPAVDKSLARLKVILRLLGDLFIAGVYTDAAVLTRCVAQLVIGPKVKAGGAVLLGLLGIATAFVKGCGSDLLGVAAAPPPAPRDPAAAGSAAELEAPAERHVEVINAKLQADLRRILGEEFLGHTGDVLAAAFKDIAETRAENERMITSRGELTEDQRKLFERKKAYLEKYHATALGLAELLGLAAKIPEIPELTVTPNAGNQNIYFTSYSLAPSLAADLPPEPLEPLPAFEDEEARALYEDLPDLRRLIPDAILHGRRQAEEDAEEEPERDTRKKAEASPAAGTAAAASKEEKRAQDAAAMEGLLARLGAACTKDAIDQLAADFLTFSFADFGGPTARNHKTYRIKLVRALLAPPRTMLELLPYHARLVATLNQYFKDVGPTVGAKLEEDFLTHFANKNQMHIESKICNIRYLGELTKFRVCPEAQILRLLAKCLDEFTHHNIDVTCAAFDTCGRFLLRQPCCYQRTTNLLQLMMRLRSIRTHDTRHETAIDAAFYSCVPRGKYKQFKEPKVLTPIQKYVRHLVTEELSKPTLKKVLKQLLKLDWDDPQTAKFVVKSLRRVGRTKYSSVHLVASLTAALEKHHSIVGVRVVDSLLEDIRYGMESDTPGQPGGFPPQRRLLDLRLFGELYNYCVFDAALVFEQLYQILFYAAYNDPPPETFRIRMVCALLEATAPYFLDTPSARKKLLRFMPYFYRFVLSKLKPFPVDLDFTFAEILELIQSLVPAAEASSPAMKFPDSLQVANELIADAEGRALWGTALSPPPTRGEAAAVLHAYQLLHGAERGLQLATRVATAPDLPSAVSAAKEVAAAVSVLSEDRPGAVWPISHSTLSGPEGPTGEAEEEEDAEGAGRGGEARHRVGDGDDDGGDDGDEYSREPRSDQSDDSSPKGRSHGFPGPNAAAAAAAGNGKKEADLEAKEFDDLFGAAMKESVAEAQGGHAIRRVAAGGSSKKLASGLALPLNQYLKQMAKHTQDQQMLRVVEEDDDRRSDSDEGSPIGGGEVLPFTIVLKRKKDAAGAAAAGDRSARAAAKEAVVDVKGSKEVIVRKFNVPMDTRLAKEMQRSLEAERREHEDSKRRILEFERRESGRPPLMLGNAHLYQPHNNWLT